MFGGLTQIDVGSWYAGIEDRFDSATECSEGALVAAIEAAIEAARREDGRRMTSRGSGDVAFDRGSHPRVQLTDGFFADDLITDDSPCGDEVLASASAAGTFDPCDVPKDPELVTRLPFY